MRAQVVLTPTESKKLIAKAVARMDIVKQAVEEGIVVMHPSSSTYFIAEELTGQKPKTDVWLCGIIVPKAACAEVGVLHAGPSTIHGTPDSFPHSWVVKKGELSWGTELGTLTNNMGTKDVYIKGVNAVDADGIVGVLAGNPAEGGTIARVIAASKRNGFKIIFPVGLEKLLPIPIKEAAREALPRGIDYSMGIPCALVICEGITVTEPKAIEILTGATATPIAAGGVGGAEGSVVLVIKGDAEQVNKAVEYVEASKGARLPQVRTFNCYDCHMHKIGVCRTVIDKHWV